LGIFEIGASIEEFSGTLEFGHFTGFSGGGSRESGAYTGSDWGGGRGRA